MEEKQKITVNEDEFCLVMAKAIKETANSICGSENKALFMSLSALTGEKAWNMLVGLSRIAEWSYK